MRGPNLITPRGIEGIQNELDWLRTVERPRIVAEVSYAASLGDRSENAEYIYGKKRLREIDARIGRIIDALNRIEIVDPATQRGPMVRFGATVVVEDEQGRQRTWRIYGAQEVDVDAGILSHHSPLARAVMGREEGEVVTFESPGGPRELEIVAVRYEAQDPLPEPEWRKGRKPGPTLAEAEDHHER